MDDRSWMYRRLMGGRLNPEYIVGVRRFINFSYSIDKNVSMGKIRCPCVRCKNQKFLKEDDVCKHLLTRGFLPSYENWTVHGEPYVADLISAGPSSVGSNCVVNDEGDANSYRKEPTWDDDFSDLQQSAKESGIYVDNKSKTVVENYQKKTITKDETDQEIHPSFNGAAWRVASKGVTKVRVYGASRMPKPIVSTSFSSHFSSSIQKLKEEFKKRDDIILKMKREIDSITEFLMNNYGWNGGTSNMGQGMTIPVAPSMPSHTMTPMGPVSSPVYQPRPQLPYIGPSSSSTAS